MTSRTKLAVLLLAHGSPDSPADVPEFLQQITGGRPMPEAVVNEVKHRYGLIGRSPLTEITLRQGQSVQQLTGLPAYVGMRNWKPFVSDVVAQMARDGMQKAIAICLAPQNSRTNSTSAFTFSTGVSCRMPCPRLKMCPGRPPARRSTS